MSVSALSTPRALGGVSGLLQVASLLGLVLLLLKAAQLYLRRQWLLKALQQFPSPPSHWLYGHMQEFQEETELQPLLKWVEKYPSACARWLWGTKALVLIYDPDYKRWSWGDQSHDSYRMLIPWIGNGLLVLEGQTWFQHRRMLTPAFHYDILKPYNMRTKVDMGLMADSVRVMLDKWEGLINPDSHLEVLGHVSLMTLDTIMKCAFGHQGSIQTDRWSDPAEEGSPAEGARAGEGEEQEAPGFPGHPPLRQKPLVVRPHLPSEWLPFRDHLDQMPYITIRIKERYDGGGDGMLPPDRHLPCYPSGILVPWWIGARSLTPPVLAPVLSLQVFDPSRFAPGSDRHSYAFLPFSGGSRNCIGKQFAMNEMKVAVALTLLRFELAPDPSRVPVPIPRVVLKPKNGIHLQLRKLL
uniref:Uncharacterized protein n=1 Tax=Phocoena sinus TaxID=42100 RepID=A0A8C9E1I6_PHOSS